MARDLLLHQQTGVLTERELARRGALAPESRLKQGPVVIVECVENIPCNPCAFACPRKAITIEGKLTDTPRVDFHKCNGCTLCIAKCPGLAIFVVHRDWSKTHSTVTIPYELLPRPQVGERVGLLDRSGKATGTGEVLRVLDSKAQNRCAVVTVKVPKRLYNSVRSIRVRGAR